jgi:hypothetical protein
MKSWNNLTDAEKETAQVKEFQETMKSICEAPGFFPELEQEIQKSQEEAERCQTPWFFPEILYHETGAKKIIDALVLDTCKTAIYLEPGEHAIYL